MSLTPPDNPPHVFDLDPGALEATITDLGLPRFRSDQVRQWLYEKDVADPQAMANLAKADRAKLAEQLTWTTMNVVGHQAATDGTQKLLLQITEGPASGGGVECVMIPAGNVGGGERRTACISSQVGCPVGCTFCASGLGGLEANLTAGQIVEQVHHLNALGAGRITNVVFMGMGEPLSNFDNVLRAITTLAADWAYDISARRMTLSTVGLPAQIRRLAEKNAPPITLAISLHAPNDDLRRSLIPWASFTSIDAIIDAARHYFKATGR